MVKLVLAASAGLPAVVPLLAMIAAKVVVGALPLAIIFLTVLLVAPFRADALAIQTAEDAVPVLVFSIVKLLSVVPLLEPSIIT